MDMDMDMDMDMGMDSSPSLGRAPASDLRHGHGLTVTPRPS
jgi:hypothetical protein